MKYDIHGNKILITDAIRNYIEEKLSRLNKYFEKHDQITARVVLKVRGRDQIIEVTIPMSPFTLRNEEKHDDLYAAIDLVADKLERQIVKNKDRIQSKAFRLKGKDIDDEDIEMEEEIVRRKKLDTKPMNEEEAILQMNMLGHDFFIYRDADTNEVNVLYRRKDGNYGIIEAK
ncbi:MAG: ribosome-associated translation inhibitor RaiA [Bacilli bacterium]|nr:ribosome-associated translation inhibitor RaiA [Bacilli bacterium]MDD4298608.1 ribosome-associated translation inhibitor RaiA [Bacilli bacterium]